MVLEYKVEFIDEAGEGQSAYIHTNRDVNEAAEYVDRTAKTEWESFKNTHKDFTPPQLFESLLGVNGVQEAAVHAHRVWIIRTLAISWDTIINNVLSVLRSFYGEGSSQELPGSGEFLPQNIRRRTLEANRYRLKPFGQRRDSIKCNDTCDCEE